MKRTRTHSTDDAEQDEPLMEGSSTLEHDLTYYEAANEDGITS